MQNCEIGGIGGAVLTALIHTKIAGGATLVAQIESQSALSATKQ